MQATLPETAFQKTCTLLWDECALISLKAQALLESGLATADHEAFDMASCDQEFLELEYNDFLEGFDAILKEISARGQFLVQGRNMGWRHLSGFAEIEAPDATAFIAQAFPKTSEWTLHGQFDQERKILTYTLTHHDAPTGEFYQVQERED